MIFFDKFLSYTKKLRNGLSYYQKHTNMGPGTKEAAKKGRLLVRTKYSVKKLIMNILNYIKISTQ